MPELVAKISQEIADELLNDERYIYDVVTHYYGYKVIHKDDAPLVLSPSQYDLVPWIDYKDSFGIGIPAPRRRKPRK